MARKPRSDLAEDSNRFFCVCVLICFRVVRVLAYRRVSVWVLRENAGGFPRRDVPKNGGKVEDIRSCEGNVGQVVKRLGVWCSGPVVFGRGVRQSEEAEGMGIS